MLTDYTSRTKGELDQGEGTCIYKHIIACLSKRECLNVGTVPTYKMHNIGTVPTFKMHNVGTVPMFKMYNIGTPKI